MGLPQVLTGLVNRKELAFLAQHEIISGLSNTGKTVIGNLHVMAARKHTGERTVVITADGEYRSVCEYYDGHYLEPGAGAPGDTPLLVVNAFSELAFLPDVDRVGLKADLAGLFRALCDRNPRLLLMDHVLLDDVPDPLAAVQALRRFHPGRFTVITRAPVVTPFPPDVDLTLLRQGEDTIQATAEALGLADGTVKRLLIAEQGMGLTLTGGQSFWNHIDPSPNELAIMHGEAVHPVSWRS